MPITLPENIAKALAEQKIEAEELSPALRAIVKSIGKGSSKPSSPCLDPYQILELQCDIAFHVNSQNTVLWYHADALLAQHIPEGLDAGAHLQAYLPKQAYTKIDELLSPQLEQASGIEHQTIELSLVNEVQSYQAKIIDDSHEGHVILLSRKTKQLGNESKYIESIRQLEAFNTELIKLSKELNNAHSDDTLYQSIAESAKSVLEADRVSVWLFAADERVLELKYDCSNGLGARYAHSSICRAEFPEFFENLDNERVHAIQLEKQAPWAEQSLNHGLYQKGVRSVLEAPIRFECEVIGLLRAEFYSEQHCWANNELSFLASLSDLCALAHEKIAKDQAEAALYLSESRFKDLTENSDTAIFAFETTFLYANPAFESMTGVDLDSLKVTDIENVFNKHFQTVHKQAAMHSRISGESQTSIKNEFEITSAIGERRWLYVTATRSNFDGNACWLASAFDITERKTSEARLKFLASHDQLTGLPNRSRFQERISSALSRASRDRFYKFAVLFINIDRFKVFNDSMGQLFGDQLLLELSKRIRLCLDITGMAARVSGDEFAVFIDDVMNAEGVLSSAKAIQAGISEPFHFENQETVCNASIGMVLADRRYQKPEHILRDASIAMYHAKENETPSFRFFDPEMHEHAKRIVETESELRVAIRKQTLELYYQPIVRLKDGAVSYFESLIRWNKTSSKVISPLDFIPLAEESGVILPLGRWIVNKAGEQLARWQNEGFPHIGVSVNVSGKQFQSQEISEDVKGLLKEKDIRENSLKIEITESSMIQNSETIQDQLQNLRELGCDLLVDDFGTGYSSLSYLHQFPITCIKIDRSFITTLRQDEDSQEIVRAITNLAHNLRLDVVAEGVETREQAEILKKIGCDYAQGFYISPPLQADDATAFLNKNGSNTILSLLS